MDLEIGKLVRINTEDCPASPVCPGKHPFNHLKYHGGVGRIEADARHFTGSDHKVGCVSCGHTMTVSQWVAATGHFWVVHVRDGRHPTFHTSELTETVSTDDMLQETLDIMDQEEKCLVTAVATKTPAVPASEMSGPVEVDIATLETYYAKRLLYPFTVLDRHKLKAAEMYGVRYSEVTEGMRRIAKHLNFAVYYGFQGGPDAATLG